VLGIPLAKIPVRPETVDRWKQDDGVNYFDFFAPAMHEYGYPIPEPEPAQAMTTQAQEVMA
ncbi:MAG: hypothetical protein N2439_08730, partial [Anaerolineae bacterium]|nr:hypothetical protein [Anaerolineae bacterium]